MRLNRLWFYKILILPVVAILTGCSVPAITIWSPDGNQAAYAVQGQGFVIDPDGKKVAELGESLGGFAWSSDSQTLYHARISQPKTDLHPTDVVNTWLPDPKHPTTNPTPTETLSVVSRRVAGKSEALFNITGTVQLLKLSPDGKWIAISSRLEGEGDLAYQVYVYSIASGKLYLLDDAAGFPLAFSAPGKLLYVASDHSARDLTTARGELTEVSLEPEIDQSPARETLVDVLAGETTWIEPVGTTIFFTSRARSFPAGVVPEGKDEPPVKIFSFTRADRKLVAITEASDVLFSISPDGKRVLYRRPSDKNEGELVVMNLNGSDARVLGVMTAIGNTAALPAWRGNDEISWTSTKSVATDVSTDGKQEKIRYYDLVLYHLGNAEPLTVERVLSKDWNNDMKPMVKDQNFNITTTTPATSRPTTMPSTTTSPATTPKPSEPNPADQTP